MKRVLIALSAAVLMYGCAREEVVVNPAEKQEQTSSENGDYIQGEVIVKLSDELTSLVEEDLAAAVAAPDRGREERLLLRTRQPAQQHPVHGPPSRCPRPTPSAGL